MFIQDHQGVLKGTVIERERALEEGLACESHQADAPASMMLHIVQHGEFGALQSAGRDVGGQHALGTVNNEHHVLAQQVAGVLSFAPLRAREGETRAGDGQREHDVFYPLAQRAVGSGQAV